MFIGNFAMLPTISIYSYAFTALESVVSDEMEGNLNTDSFQVLERVLVVIGAFVGLFLVYYISTEVKQ